MQHIKKKKDKTDSDLQEAVIVRTKRNLLDDVKKPPQTVLHFSLTFSSALKKKNHTFSEKLIVFLSHWVPEKSFGFSVS